MWIIKVVMANRFMFVFNCVLDRLDDHDFDIPPNNDVQHVSLAEVSDE